MDNKKLIKEDTGVAIYQEGDNLVMYIEEHRTLQLNKQFKGILDKSFNELVKIRKQNSDKTE